MNVSLTPKLEKFVQQQVESGLYTSASDVVRAGLRRLEDADRIIKASRYDELRREIQLGIDDSHAGRVKLFSAERIKARVRKALSQGKSRAGDARC